MRNRQQELQKWKPTKRKEEDIAPVGSIPSTKIDRPAKKETEDDFRTHFAKNNISGGNDDAIRGEQGNGPVPAGKIEPAAAVNPAVSVNSNLKNKFKDDGDDDDEDEDSGDDGSGGGNGNRINTNNKHALEQKQQCIVHPSDCICILRKQMRGMNFFFPPPFLSATMVQHDDLHCHLTEDSFTESTSRTR